MYCRGDFRHRRLTENQATAHPREVILSRRTPPGPDRPILPKQRIVACLKKDSFRGRMVCCGNRHRSLGDRYRNAVGRITLDSEPRADVDDRRAASTYGEPLHPVTFGYVEPGVAGDFHLSYPLLVPAREPDRAHRAEDDPTAIGKG